MHGYTGIKSLAKNMEIYAGKDLIMQGGADTVAYAELYALKKHIVNMRGMSTRGNPQGSVTMTAGTAAGAEARILGSESTLLVNCAVDMVLDGGAISLAFIRNLGAGTMQRVTLINAGNNMTLNQNSFFRHDGDSIMIADAGTNMVLNSNAFILNQGSGLFMNMGRNLTLNDVSFVENMLNGTYYADAGNNIVLNGSSRIQNLGTGEMEIFSDVNMSMNSTSKLETTSGAITVVVDNKYPVFPFIGKGSFAKAAGVVIKSTAGGKVRIFTAMRELNSVIGAINGTTYVEGPFEIDSATEKWFTYYPGDYGGSPFTFFYKNPGSIPVIVIVTTEQVLASEFQNMQTFDDFLFAQDADFVEFATSLTAAGEGNILSKSNLNMLRRIVRNYHTKKTLKPIKIDPAERPTP